MGSVLVIEAIEGLRRQLLLGLRGHGIEAEAVNEILAAGPLVHSGRVDVVLLGPGLGRSQDALAEFASVLSPQAGEGEGKGEGDKEADDDALFKRADSAPDLLVLLGGDGSARSGTAPPGATLLLEEGLGALRLGAADFVLVSDGSDAVALAVRKLRARRVGTPAATKTSPQGAQIRSVPPGRPSPSAAPVASSPPVLVGSSPKITAVLRLITRLAGVRTGVLVGGESGTGKELVARALHDHSPWRAGPFVAVNCGAIPAGLIESELFGHVRGAFTDAVRDKQGLFQAADGGTLFLDEIADLPLALQPKLLRALQDGVVRRVGDSDDVQVSVRVVAATARDLTIEVGTRRFREDLYYRLAGLTIQLPPLRERPDDIPVLAMHFLSRTHSRLGIAVRDIDPEALRLLVNYRWPGNVRELENTIERAAVLCSDNRVDVASLPERMVPASVVAAVSVAAAPGGGGGVPAGSGGAGEVAAGGNMSIKQAARRSEEELIVRALGVTGGNRTKAAELLEISHRALLYKIKEYGITVASRKEAGAAPPALPSGLTNSKPSI